MKKSKIIIPALGMLLLSTAASVSGTVAWFTTVSTADAQISSFAIRKLGGDLDLTIKTEADNTTGEGAVTYGIGTAKSGNAIVLKDQASKDTALCDASYKHTSTAGVYKANNSATQFETVAESNWKVSSGGKDTYYAVSWTLEFGYTFGGDASNVNLYFDLQNASLEPTAGTDGSAATGETWKGFRIAFICGSRTVVWAGGHTTSEASGLHYQTSANSQGGGDYVNANSANQLGDLITGFGTSSDSGYPAAVAILPGSENSPQSGTRSDFIGQFTTSTTTLSVKCIAWYEGNDDNVINGARMDTVSAVMAFYTRTAA